MAGGRPTRRRSNETDMAWLAHISDWQAETADPGEFLDSLRFEIGAKEVYVFTPKGRVIGLPAGATPVDFAYAVHTEVGPPHDGREGQRPTRAARERAVERRRRRGVHVEEPGCRSEPGLARTSSRAHARAARSGGWFTKERREEAIEQGKDAIARAMRKQNLPLQQLMSQDVLRRGRARSCATTTSRRSTPRSARATSRRSRSSRRSSALVARRRRGRRADAAACSVASASAAAEPRLRRARARRARHPRQARQVLHPRAGRRDRRLRHARRGCRCTAATVTTCSRSCEEPERMIDVEWAPTLQERLPRADPDRGARPGRAALRRHARALGAPREHPLGERLDLDRPPGAQPIRLRDGRHRRTSTACSTPCGASTPSTTSIASATAERATSLEADAARSPPQRPRRAGARPRERYGIRRAASRRAWSSPRAPAARPRVARRSRRLRDRRVPARGAGRTPCAAGEVQPHAADDDDPSPSRQGHLAHLRSMVADHGDACTVRARRTARRSGGDRGRRAPTRRTGARSRGRARTRSATTAARNDGRSGSSTGAQPSSSAKSSPSRRAAQSSASGRSSGAEHAGSRGHAAMLAASAALCRVARRRLWTTCRRGRCGRVGRTAGLSRRGPSARRGALRALRGAFAIGALRRPTPSRRRVRPRASRSPRAAGASMPSERAFFSGSSRCQRSLRASARAFSILRRRSSTTRTWSRGTLPISSHLRWMRLRAARALLGVASRR